MNFLYPYMFVIFIVGAAIILLKSTAVRFTHLGFFQKKRSFPKDVLLDLLTLFAVTLAAMYPYTYTTKHTSIKSTFISDLPAKTTNTVLVMDVSLSMENDDYLEAEKSDAKEYISKTKGYFAIVAFEKEYKLLQNFTNIKPTLYTVIDSLKANMITNIGGSRLKDTIAYAINLVKNRLNPTVIIFSDGSDNDESSITLQELVKEAYRYHVKIIYKPYGYNEANNPYKDAFSNYVFSTFTHKEKEKKITFTKKVSYSQMEMIPLFLYLAILLVGTRIVLMRRLT